MVAAHRGERLRSDVAVPDSPFVGLLGEEGADEADNSGTVREDPDHVGPPADLLVEAFL
jgi:hypothetical protein